MAEQAVEASDEAAQWVTTEQAAAALGLSDSGFRALARREGIVVRRRGPLPGVHRPSLDEYIARSRIAPRRPLPIPDPDPEWIPVAVAARRLGISRHLFWKITRWEGICRVRPDGRPGVRVADLEALVSRSLVQPGAPPADRTKAKANLR